MASLKARMLEGEGFVAGSHPHRKRLYFLDRDGQEWEFVEYLSERSSEEPVPGLQWVKA